MIHRLSIDGIFETLRLRVLDLPPSEALRGEGVALSPCLVQRLLTELNSAMRSIGRCVASVPTIGNMGEP